MNILESVPRRLQAVRYTGSNLDEVRLIFPAAEEADGGAVIVREDGRLPRVLAPGDWAARNLASGFRSVISGPSAADGYRAAGEENQP